MQNQIQLKKHSFSQEHLRVQTGTYLQHKQQQKQQKKQMKQQKKLAKQQKKLAKQKNKFNINKSIKKNKFLSKGSKGFLKFKK